MFRIIYGLILSSICGIYVLTAFISFAADEIDKRELGDIILRSILLTGIPGCLLCQSGGQNLRSQKGGKAVDNELKETSKINVSDTSEQQQEEIEIWNTYVESGWYATCQKYPKFVVARIIDRTQKEPQISDYIPQDLRDKIIDKWK